MVIHSNDFEIDDEKLVYGMDLDNLKLLLRNVLLMLKKLLIHKISSDVQEIK